MTAITSVIIPDAEAFIRENIHDFTYDIHSVVYPLTTFQEDGSRSYWDMEEGKRKDVGIIEHVHALRLLAQLIDEKKLHVGGLKSAIELIDPCNWDVEVVDSYFQLIFHGEVIYG